MTNTNELNTSCVYCDTTIQQPATVCAPCARVEFGETCGFCDMPDCTVDHYAQMEALQNEEETTVTNTNEFNTNCLYCATAITVELGELHVCMSCAGHLNDDPDFETYGDAWERQHRAGGDYRLAKSITVSTEKQDVTITTREQALRMIKTTVYFHQFDTHQEIKEFAKLQEVAALFSIDTNELVIATTDNQKDYDNGWPLVYRWKNEPEEIPAIAEAQAYEAEEAEETDRSLRAIAQAQVFEDES